MEAPPNNNQAANREEPTVPTKGLNRQTAGVGEACGTLTYEQRMRPLWLTYRNILLVVLLIFVFALVQTLMLWRVCDVGMKTAASLKQQGLPTLNGLASLQEHLAIYRLNAYEHLFAREGEKSEKAKAVQDISARTRAELRNIKILLPDAEGGRLASNLENAFTDLDTEFGKVQNLEDSDFAGAMREMDQNIPGLTARVNAAANAFSHYGYHFSGEEANATFESFGWIKKNAILFGSANIVVAFGAVLFVLLAARRSRAQLSQTLAQVEERTRELANSQALYQSLVDQLPAGVFRKDTDGRFVFVNSWFCRAKGMKADQILGRTASEMAASELQNSTTKWQQELTTQGSGHHELIMQTGQIIEVKEVYSDVDGKVQNLRVTKSPVFDFGGKIVGTQGMLFDITAREQAEAELAQERNLLRTMIDNLPEAIYIKDLSGRKTLANPAELKNMGFKTEAEAVGKGDFEIYPQELAAAYFADDQAVIQTGQSLINREEKVVTPAGETHWFLSSKIPLRNAAGNIIGLVGVGRDVTAIKEAEIKLEKTRKQAEAELSYERDLLRAFLDNSPDSIYFKDTQSRFLRTSESQVRLFGLKSVDELVGKTDFDFFTEEHARPAFENEQEIIQTGRPLIGKLEKEILKSGRQSWVLTNKMPLRNKDGQIIGTFGISKDITDIKETEAKLEKVHKQLLETSRQSGMAEIATNVLHNVGNILNSVNVSSSLVTDNLRKSKAPNLSKAVALMQEHTADLGAFLTNDARGKQLPGYLAQLAGHLTDERDAALTELVGLQKNIEHIKEIVAMQQNYAKVSGVTEIINVRELVEDSLRMSEEALNRHRVELIREFEEVPPINIEKHKLLQILVNLIRNAKHACQDSERPDKRLTVRVAKSDGQIKISVSDNGVGIPPENLIRIFNHGFTTKKDGHGYGLHSGALAAKEMGGALHVHSKGQDQGATFTLELPLQPICSVS